MALTQQGTYSVPVLKLQLHKLWQILPSPDALFELHGHCDPGHLVIQFHPPECFSDLFWMILTLQKEALKASNPLWQHE